MHDIDATELKALLDDARVRHGVVGAAIGVLSGGQIKTAGSGLLNISTGVETTADSAFQIGSITKIFTTTLIMQLVDEGRVALDGPVIKYLPNFMVAVPEAARSITVRQLLNHTSGLDGDFFPEDDPEGPSAASYVRKMRLLPTLYPPGLGPVTYSNSAFVVAGRIVEVLTGSTWQNAVMDRICRPLELPVAFADPHESLRYRCAMGHVRDPEDENKAIIAPATYLPLSAAAAGTVLMMSAESLLMFAKALINDGTYGERKQILSLESVRAMRDEKVPVLPCTTRTVTHWGLGWMLEEAAAYRAALHGGATSGQFAYLKTFPEKGIAFTLLTNSPSGKLTEVVETLLLERLLSISRLDEPKRENLNLDHACYIGIYENVGGRLVVEERDRQLWLRQESKLQVERKIESRIEPYRPGAFAMTGDADFEGVKVVFGDVENDKATFLHCWGRMYRRQWGTVCQLDPSHTEAGVTNQAVARS
jgi:CubicO group peptidase (beta-lactamase class C family)